MKINIVDQMKLLMKTHKMLIKRRNKLNHQKLLIKYLFNNQYCKKKNIMKQPKLSLIIKIMKNQFKKYWLNKKERKNQEMIN